MATHSFFRVRIFACLVGLGFLVISGTAPRFQAHAQKPPAGPQTTVPNVVGMNLTQAENELKGAQLDHTLSSKRENTTDKTKQNTVASQTPAAGAQAGVGSKVTVVLYKYVAGPAQTRVPNVVGMDRAQAEKQVIQAQLRPVDNKQTITTSDQNKNAVVASQNPPAGTQVAVNSAVTVVYYRYNSAYTTVPNVVGMDRVHANREIEQARLRIVESRQSEDTTDKTKNNVVASQSPAAGTETAARSAVTVVCYRYNSAYTTVPNVVGMKLADAHATLTQARLDTHGAPSYQPTSERNKGGTVVSTAPAAGAQVASGTMVSLTVYAFGAGGTKKEKPDPTGGKVTVPSVVGLKSSQAMTVLSHVSLVGKPASDTQITNDPTKDGMVASQSPAAGAQVDAQTLVVFTLYIAAEKAGSKP